MIKLLYMRYIERRLGVGTLEDPYRRGLQVFTTGRDYVAETESNVGVMCEYQKLKMTYCLFKEIKL